MRYRYGWVRSSRPSRQYNDEGYYWDYCPEERKRTEHERGECLSCWNKKLKESK